MADREELIRNAVAFLQDPKSQASPLAQRVQFLESKGLTPPEIDLAVRQASLNQSATPYRTTYPSAFSNPYTSNQWDWRDYFIGAVISGTVVYGAVSLFKKYLAPHLRPPTTTVYEDDRDALTAQFDAAEALLKEIQAETAAVKTAVEEQKEKVDKTVKDVQDVVSEMHETEAKTRDELREIREEVNTVREMLPKMIEKNKDSQNQSLADLQQELKSLKALLLSRGPSMSSVSSPAPMVGRPSIPAWQLASSAAPSSGPSSFAPAVSTPITTPPVSDAVTINGKGKGPEVSDIQS